MWIKTKDGRLVDVAGGIVEKVVAVEGDAALVQLVPRQGKTIQLSPQLTIEGSRTVMAFIENSIANGRLLIQLE